MKFCLLFFSIIIFLGCSSQDGKNVAETEEFEIEDSETGDFETGDDELVDEEMHPEITESVLLETNKGDVKLGLYGVEVPDTVDNFIQYVKAGFYDGLIFHRVISGFVIQGGGFNEQLEPAETRAPIPFEGTPKIKHVKYALSMARSNSINSASSQFFITLDVFPHLDFTNEDDFYDENKFPCTAFGIVLEGFEVVDAIAEVETDEGDVPVDAVIIKKAQVAEMDSVYSEK